MSFLSDLIKEKLGSADNVSQTKYIDFESFEELFAFSNPFWLSDIFICGRIEGWKRICYVKVNYEDKIEEIGVDIEKRFHAKAVDEKLISKVTENQRRIFESFGDEYWWKLIKRLKYEE